MKNNFTKMLAVGTLAGLVSLGAVMPAYASSPKDDSAITNGNPCIVKVQSNNGFKYLNTFYIRNFETIESDPSVLRIELASNYSNYVSNIDIKYGSPAIAEKSAEVIADKITFCREQAANRKNQAASGNQVNNIKKP